MIESVGGDVKPLTSVPVPDLEIRSGGGGVGRWRSSRLSCIFSANFNCVNVFSLFFEHVT